EDGIRDGHVTGVQTCALPIWARRGGRGWTHVEDRQPISVFAGLLALAGFLVVIGPWWARQLLTFGSISPTSSSGAALWIRNYLRSEERRVGKGGGVWLWGAVV